MQAREFLTEIEQLDEVFHWRRLENNAIRAFLKSDEKAAALHPINAVALVKNGGKPPSQSRDIAGRLLGLSDADIDAISDAANGAVWTYVDDHLVLDGYREWLRDRIELACGLDDDELFLEPRRRHGIVVAVSSPEGQPDRTAQPQHCR